MEIDKKNFEFYTFFLGLKQRELEQLRKLFESFPYYDTHKINVIDKSLATKSYIESNKKKFYISWRSYIIDPENDLNYEECEELFNEYKDNVNRIVETKYLFHGESIDKVIKKFSKSAYTVIMDSDIIFTSDRYLSDMKNLCNKYSYDELAAIGSLYQSGPFYLTLNPEIPIQIYHMFLTSKKMDFKSLLSLGIYLLKFGINHMIKKTIKIKRKDSLGRFPRFHPALLLINTKIFNMYNMSFQNLYLDVLDLKHRFETKHRVIGDNGASFLYQCALAGKNVVSIDFNEYVKHEHQVSAADKKAEGWNWFNKEFSDDPMH
jgi:hypothetical protein